MNARRKKEVATTVSVCMPPVLAKRLEGYIQKEAWRGVHVSRSSLIQSAIADYLDRL